MIPAGKSGLRPALKARLFLPLLLFCALLGAQACETWKKEKTIPPADVLYEEALGLYEGRPNWAARKFPKLREKYKDTRAAFLFRKRNYTMALEKFQEVIYNYPFSKYAILSELRIADCHYGMTEYEIAAQYYEDFIRLHPVHEQVAYATYRLGCCHYEQRLKPGRDQTETELAMVQFRLIMSLYPEDSFSQDAAVKLQECEERLASHNYRIARFYLKSDNYWAAAKRFEKIWRNYPDAALAEEALFRNAVCFEKLNRFKEADMLYDVLLIKFPEGSYSGQAVGRKAAVEEMAADKKAGRE